MIKLMKGWYYRHFSQPGTIEFALVLIVSFLIIFYLMWLVGPIVVALCLAYILDWPVSFLIYRFRFPRLLSAAAVMLCFVGVCIGLLVFVVPKILQQGNEFYHNLQTWGQQDSLNLAAAEDDGLSPVSLEKEDLDDVIAGRLYALADKLPDQVSSMITQEDVKASVVKARREITATVASFIKTQLMPSVFNFMSGVMYLIIVPVFMFLMLANKPGLQRRMTTYVLPNNQVLIHEFWPKINSQIEGYIRGKILHIIIIAITNTAALKLFGMNYAFLLGFGIGLSVVIPYVGAVIISIPVVLVALLQFGVSSTFVWLLAVYLIIQLLDSNVLTPLLFSKAMNLDAFSILAAILIFGGLWGFWGVFFSIPLATFIRTLIVQWPNADDNKESSASKGTALELKNSGNKIDRI